MIRDAIERRPEAQKGAALLIVLWIALLVSALMAGAIASARIEAKIAAARLQRFKGEEALKSALDFAAWRIAVGDAQAENDAPIVEDFTLNGFTVSVEPSAEMRKLDVNLASEEVWMQTLQRAGVDAEKAQVYAARIADWRDEDDLVRPNGAEGREYRAKNLMIGDRPFYSIGELRAVMGLPPGLVDCLAPQLSLFASGAPPRAADADGDSAADSRKASASRATLGTASRTTTAGRRFVLEAAATPTNRSFAPLRLAGAFRAMGGREEIYQWIAKLVDRTDARLCDPAR